MIESIESYPFNFKCNNDIVYTFIPKKVLNFNKKECLVTNAIYQKHVAEIGLAGDLISCREKIDDQTKKDPFCANIVKETYQQYIDKLPTRDTKKDKWIYNIIDGVSEAEKVIYRDESVIIIPNYTWDEKDVKVLHVLAIPTDKSLRSIRELNMSHISLLEHCKKTTLKIIKERYLVDEERLKMFFHYTPSTYHLHIHFATITNKKCNSSIEYSHDLSTVIFNLSINTDYYKLVVLNKRMHQ